MGALILVGTGTTFKALIRELDKTVDCRSSDATSTFRGDRGTLVSGLRGLRCPWPTLAGWPGDAGT